MAEIVKINGIPVYDAIITDEETGMLKISLVDDPAVMSNFLAFDKDKKVLMFAVEDEEKRLVLGVVMRADFPIYRYDKKAGEYYVLYKADTIRTMAEKYLAEGRQNNVNTMHEDNSDVEGVQMVQCFIKDSAKGIVPAGFDDIADGSLFAEFHVTNDEVWDAIKAGTYQGFSLEGIFDLVPEKDQEEVDDIVSLLDGAFSRLFKNSNTKTMSKIKKLKAMLAQALMELGNVTTDKGILVWDGDDDLKAGDAVFFEDADGNRTTPEDGDYKTEDGKVIVVVEGKVSEIRDDAAQVADQFGSKATDKGELIWEGEGDLKAGDAVFVKDENGENVAAPDGDYKTEDGKIIKVADGKVTEIVDDDAQVGSEEELKARKIARLAKIRQAFEDSYEEKERKIMEAVAATLAEGEYAYLVEAGDSYAVINLYTEENWEGKYIKYAVSFDEAGNVILGDAEEVKSAFVPVDADNPAEPAVSAEEVAAIKAENESLKAELEQLKKQPLKQSAHDRSKAGEGEIQTGDKGLDRLAKFARRK